jgi:hypothetical protein
MLRQCVKVGAETGELKRTNSLLNEEIARLRGHAADACVLFAVPRVARLFIRRRFTQWQLFVRSERERHLRDELELSWTKAQKLALAVRRSRDIASNVAFVSINKVL